MFCQCENVNAGGFICSDCIKEITFFHEPLCQCGAILDAEYHEAKCVNCQLEPKFFYCARALVDYQRRTKPLIRKLKEQNDKYLFRRCAELIFRQYSDLVRSGELIVPVPTHWLRRLKRGFNPPDTLAYFLSKISGVPFSKALKKIKPSGYQKQKTKQERAENVKNSFVVKGNVANKCIVLVDDVYTTGATTNECAKQLLSAGASKIIVLTIAKTHQASLDPSASLTLLVRSMLP